MSLKPILPKRPMTNLEILKKEERERGPKISRLVKRLVPFMNDAQKQDKG